VPSTLTANVFVIGSRLLDDRRRLAFSAGVVDRDVDAAEALDSLLDDAADLGFETNVSAQEFSLGAEGTQFGGEGLPCLLATAADDDAVSLAGEGDSCGTADSGQRACDEDDRLVHVSAPWVGVALNRVCDG
jgi:hypothetical protein